MSLPSLRNRISISTGNRNSSLKSILSPTGEALEVLSVEAIDAPLHNTKITVSVSYKNKLDEGSNDVKGRRAILYNRLNLNQVIPEDAVLDLTDIVKTIKLLNTKYQCDFTEDDLELVDRILTAKPTSLGYVGALDSAAGPREISCDGATEDAIIMILVHESITEEEFFGAIPSLQIEINDQVYTASDETTEFLNRHVKEENYRENLTPDQFSLVPEGWILLEAFRLSNITSDPLRIKYGFSEMITEKIKFIPLETVNPTSYNDEETGAAAFCLAPQELVCKPELYYGITIDNWAETEEQYQIIYDAIDHIRNTFEAEDPNANSVYVSYGSELDENNSVLTAYIRIKFEDRYMSNPPPNGLGGSFKVKFQLPAINSYSDWYEYDVSYGDDGSEYTLVSELGSASYARDINACLIQVIARPLA